MGSFRGFILTKKRIREKYSWNSEVYNEKVYTDSKTGVSYCLKHMSTSTIPLKYEFKDGTEKYKGELDVTVVFDHHCYTSSKKHGDARETLVTDHYNDGSFEERAFDMERYQYSHTLVKVISNLSYKMCRESRVVGKAIRLEDRDSRNPRSGIYILMKLRKTDNKPLTLYIETAHHRTNEPSDAQLKAQDERYMLIFGRMLRDHWRGLV